MARELNDTDRWLAEQDVSRIPHDPRLGASLRHQDRQESKRAAESSRAAHAHPGSLKERAEAHGRAADLHGKAAQAHRTGGDHAQAAHHDAQEKLHRDIASAHWQAAIADAHAQHAGQTRAPHAERTRAVEVHPSVHAETLSAAAHTPEQHAAARQAHLAAGILAAEKGQDHIYAHHMREASRHQAAAGIKPHAGVAQQAPAAVQTGKKGGKFVISKSGKKRYV